MDSDTEKVGSQCLEGVFEQSNMTENFKPSDITDITISK